MFAVSTCAGVAASRNARFERLNFNTPRWSHRRPFHPCPQKTPHISRGIPRFFSRRNHLALAEGLHKSLGTSCGTTTSPRSISNCSTTWSTATSGKFFFDIDVRTIADYVNYVNENLDPGADVLRRADSVMGNLYPSRTASADYTVALPADIDWDNTRYLVEPRNDARAEPPRARANLAIPHRLTGDDDFADQLIAQIADSSAESPAPDADEGRARAAVGPAQRRRPREMDVDVTRSWSPRRAGRRRQTRSSS